MDVIGVLEKAGGAGTGEWAVSYWSKSFDGLPECVSEVREYTRKVVGDTQGADLVELIASELASNAIRHSHSGCPGGQFTLHLTELRNRWQVRVDDAGGTNVPHLRQPQPMLSVEDLDRFDDEVEGGRGMVLVAAVSTAWGVLGDETAHAVWAEIATPSDMLPGPDSTARQLLS